jgi:hypothetical protein
LMALALDTLPKEQAGTIAASATEIVHRPATFFIAALVAIGAKAVKLEDI